MSRIALLWIGSICLSTAACKEESPPLPAPQAALMETVAEGILQDGDQPQAALPQGPVAERAEAFLKLLVAGRFEQARANFDAKMKQALPLDKLKLVWQTVINRNGAFVERLWANTSRRGKYDAGLMLCKFSRRNLVVKVVFDGQAVAGLFFFPDEGNGEGVYEAPGYADLGAFRDLEVTVGQSPWQLPGSLSMPSGEGPHPAVVLVHGSGPQDRDEAIGPNKPFRDLATGLASRGVAVLRYEKRTKAHAAELQQIKDRITTRQETVDDVVQAVALLEKTAGIDPARVFVLGHSLGGTLIPRIAARAPQAAGFIVLAGSSRPLEDLILEQSEYLAGLDGLSAEDREGLAEIRRQVARVKSPKLSLKTPASELPLGVPAAYWLDLRSYRPAEAARKITKPLLVLQGGRDYQVTTADFAGWKEALAGRANVTFKLYPGLNHLFAKGEGKSTPEEYERLAHVDEKVVLDIVRWINTGKVN